MLSNLGALHERHRQFSRAIDLLIQAFTIALDIDEPYYQAVALRNLGPAYRGLGCHHNALDNLQKALTIFEVSMNSLSKDAC